MLDPITKTIEVPCNAQVAFTTFVTRVSSWWPLDKHSVSAMDGKVAKEVVIEPKTGGKVYEVGHDDTLHPWGTVTRYEPHRLVAMDWHIGMPAENASEVTVRFEQLTPKRTRVELTHARWEAFGERAAQMRDGYDKGWVGVFEVAFRGAFDA